MSDANCLPFYHSRDPSVTPLRSNMALSATFSLHCRFLSRQKANAKVNFILGGIKIT